MDTKQKQSALRLFTSLITGGDEVSKISNETKTLLEKTVGMSDIYSSQSGSSVADVNTIINNLYTMYADTFYSLASSPRELVGVLAEADSNSVKDPEDPAESSSRSFSELINRISQTPLTVKPLNKQQFSLLFRDAIVAGILRGTRALFIASIDRGNYKNIKNILSLPLKHDDEDINKDLAKYYYPSKGYTAVDEKLPETNLSPATLAIFFRRPSVIAKQIKHAFAITDTEIANSYPLSVYDSISEARLSITNADEDDAINDLADAPLNSRYVIHLVISLLATLLEDSTEQGISTVLKQADLAITMPSKYSKALYNTETGEDTSKLRQLASWAKEKGNDGHFYEDYDATSNEIVQVTAARRDAVHKDYISLILHKVLDNLYGADTKRVDDLNFSCVVMSDSGAKLETKNLYYDFIDSLTDTSRYSHELSTLTYHLYNSFGKNDIPYSTEELQSFLSQLPKTTEGVLYASADPGVDSNKKSRSLLEKFAASSQPLITANNSVKVAVNVCERVINNSSGLGAYAKISNIMRGNTFKAILDTFIIDSDILLPKLTPVFYNQVVSAFKLQAALATSANAETETVFDSGLMQLENLLSDLDPNSNYRTTNPKTDFCFLYKTPENENNTPAGKYVFDNDVEFNTKNRQFLDAFNNAKADILSSGSGDEISNKITSIFNSVFGDKANTYKRFLRVKSEADSGARPVALDTRLNKIANNLYKSINSVKQSSAGKTEQKYSTAQAPITNYVKTLILAYLHCRLQFLIAVKKFSGLIYEITYTFRDTLEHLSPEILNLLQDDTLSMSPRAKKILNLISENIAHIITEGGGDPETYDGLMPEYDNPTSLHPEFKDFVDAHKKDLEERQSFRNRGNSLKYIEIPDDEL